MNDTNIEVYLLSLEFWFAATGMTFNTIKYNLVMELVSPRKVIELETIIEPAPSLKHYEYIKSKLIAQFADSQQLRAQCVLSDIPLSDLKLSQPFNDMPRIVGIALYETILIDL